jgi:hypothetical protein
VAAEDAAPKLLLPLLSLLTFILYSLEEVFPETTAATAELKGIPKCWVSSSLQTLPGEVTATFLGRDCLLLIRLLLEHRKGKKVSNSHKKKAKYTHLGYLGPQRMRQMLWQQPPLKGL